MRFFSNDARESAEDSNPDDRSPEQRAQDEQARNDEQALNEQAQNEQALNDRDAGERPDRVQSEPVVVPSQRAGSPWSDAPAETDTGADRQADVTAPDAGRDDIDPPPFHEPAPQPTAFGASTAGGAASASATAGPADDDVATSSTGTYGGGTVTAPDTVPATWTDKRDNDPDKRDDDPDEIVDVPLDDQPAAADRDANHDDAVTTFADDKKDDDVKDDSVKDDGVKDEALQDEGGFDDPQAVDPATEQPLDSTVDEPAAAPVVAAVPVAAAAASATLFDKDDASGFQERWRDVQLRFVDSPKDATGDAAKLVEEAVEKLTAALRSQREGLHADTDDTEQLRVQLRGYRDMLNRIIGL